MHRQRGFTIIEVMIVMTIIGILSALCIPLYQGYVTKSKISEAVVLSDGVKSAVVDYYAQQGELPADNAALRLGAPPTVRGRFVSSIAVAAGVVIVTYGDPALLGQTMTFTPTIDGALVRWACTTSLPQHLRPRDCA